MKRIWWFLLTSTKWLLGFLLSFVIVVILINSFDEDLTQEAKALLVVPSNQFGAEHNLYFAIMGINAPLNQSSITFAQEKITGYEKTLEASIKDPRIAFSEINIKDSQGLVFKGEIDSCKPLTTSVWSGMEKNKIDIKRLLNDNGELYQRYLALRSMPGYYETATPNALAPNVYPPSELRSLFLANFVFRIKSRNVIQQKQALTDLEGDIHIWKTMLVGDGSLVSKMLAIAYLQGNFLLLGDLIADSTIDVTKLSSELDRITTLFDLAEWKIGKSFANEFRSNQLFTEQMDSRESAILKFSDEARPEERPQWWERYWDRFSDHFFKKRATENLNAKSMSQIIKMADAAPINLYAAIDAHSKWAQENLNFWAQYRFHYLYNPLGKVLVGISAPMYEKYPLRAYDTAAIQRLIKLAYEIRRQIIPVAKVPEFMQNHPEWATHPVNGQIFSLDADKNEIAVKPLAEQPKGRRFSIPVWKITNSTVVAMPDKGL